MEESLRAQIDSNLSHLDGLIRRGRRLRETLAENPSDKSALVANRAWQQDCGVAINQLSGGSKAHWLARAFSEAFLMRTASGQVIEAVRRPRSSSALPASWIKRLFRCHEWVRNRARPVRLWPRRCPAGSSSFITSNYGRSSNKHTPTAGTRWSKADMT